MIRLALASLRTRPASMLVVALLGLLASAILTVSGTVLATAIVLPAPPERFDAPVVVAGPAGFALPDQEHQSVAYPEGSLVPASVEQTVRSLSQVGAVVEYREPTTKRLTGLGVSPRPGADTHRLADRLRKALGNDAQVLTGDRRGQAEDPGVPASRVPLIVTGAASGGVLVMVVGLVVWAALNLIIGERRTELRLWRLIGATPRQSRRLLVAEATTVAAIGAVIGAATGPVLAGWLFDALTRADALPALLRPAGPWLAAPAGWLVTVLTVWATATLISGPAVRRAATTDEPPQADREPASSVRRPLAIVIGAGATAMLLATPFLGPEGGSSVGGPATLVAVAAIAIAAPDIVCRSLPLLTWRSHADGTRRLAGLDMATRGARFGSLLALLALGVTLALGNGYAATTSAAAAQPDVLETDAVVTAEDADPAALLRAVDQAVGSSATSSLALRSSGWIEEPYDHTGSDPLPLIGVDNADALVRLGVAAGSLQDLTGDGMAITAQDAERLHLEVGDTLTYRFGDAARRRLTVAAILDSGRGSQVRIVAEGLLAEHVRTPASTVIVRAPPGDGDGLGTSLRSRLGAAGITAVVGHDPAGALSNGSAVLGSLIYLAVAAMSLLFTGVVTFYSIRALTLARREEFASWRLVGATRNQLLRLVLTQVLHITLVAIVIGTVIAFASVLAIGGGLGQWPSGSPLLFVAVATSTLGLAFVAALTSGLRATRRLLRPSGEPGGQRSI